MASKPSTNNVTKKAYLKRLKGYQQSFSSDRRRNGVETRKIQTVGEANRSWGKKGRVRSDIALAKNLAGGKKVFHHPDRGAVKERAARDLSDFEKNRGEITRTPREGRRRKRVGRPKQTIGEGMNDYREKRVAKKVNGREDHRNHPP